MDVKELQEMATQNAIVPGAGEALHITENIPDIYKILTVGEEWGMDVRTLTGVANNTSLRAAVGTNAFQTPVDNPAIDTNGKTPGSVTFPQRVLAVDEIMVYEVINPSEWKTDFPDFKPTGNLVDLRLNSKIQEAVFEILQDKVLEQESLNIVQGESTIQTSGTLTVGVEYVTTDFQAGDDFTNVSSTGALANVDGAIWTAIGTTPTTWTNSSIVQENASSFIEGLVVKVDADAEVTDVASVGAITASNALDIIEDMVQAIPARLAKKPNVKFFVSYTDFNLIQEANRATQQNSNILSVGDVPMVFGKYPLVWKNSMPKDRILVTNSGTGVDSNLVKGVWFDNDISNFLMGKDSDSHKDWYLLLRFHLGIQYRTGLDIVNYKA